MRGRHWKREGEVDGERREEGDGEGGLRRCIRKRNAPDDLLGCRVPLQFLKVLIVCVLVAHTRARTHAHI